MRVAVIGGGPAGMMAAYEAARIHEVHLFDGNEKLGKKLYLTGKGRCNVTNAAPIEDFFDAIVRNREFLYSALYTFTNRETMDWFEEYVPLKVERGGRVFPKSDKSSDILRAFEKKLKHQNVKIHMCEKVDTLTFQDDVFVVKTKKRSELFDAVVVATGGLSYPSTGSTGKGYDFAKSFGHHIVKPVPALTGFRTEREVSLLSGLSLRNVSLKAKLGSKKFYEEQGEALFTHRGISGPIALRLSSLVNREKDVTLFLDLKPALTTEELHHSLQKNFDEEPKKTLISILRLRLPRTLVPYILDDAKVQGNRAVHSITKKERERLVLTMKNLSLGRGTLEPIGGAIVTSGGVDVLELDPSRMESRKIKQLYFCGEILDVDAWTGGYNLQIAFSTGYLAGKSLCEYTQKED